MPELNQENFEFTKIQLEVSSSANRNFRARIIYKSGAMHEFLIMAISTDAFQVMRKGLLNYLGNSTQKYGTYSVGNGFVTIDWSDVSAFHDWVE